MVDIEEPHSAPLEATHHYSLICADRDGTQGALPTLHNQVVTALPYEQCIA